MKEKNYGKFFVQKNKKWNVTNFIYEKNIKKIIKNKLNNNK